MVERHTIVAIVSCVPLSRRFSALTHFPTSVWSNFEIGDLDFWRGEAYSKFVDFLDSKGGFYYEVSLRTSGFAEPGMTLVIFILIAMG